MLISKKDKSAAGNAFVLRWTGEEEIKEFPIPGHWLIPGEKAIEEEGSVVSSFKYEKTVSSFFVGKSTIGLHISSYQIQESGSLQAAAGRDLFFTLNTGSHELKRGNIDLGVTKERVRQGGCFSARFSHFLVADVNDDGYFDIGVITEKMICEERYDDAKGVDVVTGPIYGQQPSRWYVFKKDQWEHDPAYDGNLDVRYRELPLIGIKMTPVDFAAYATWRSYDPKFWKYRGEKRPEYLPRYRKDLIWGIGAAVP